MKYEVWYISLIDQSHNVKIAQFIKLEYAYTFVEAMDYPDEYSIYDADTCRWITMNFE